MMNSPIKRLDTAYHSWHLSNSQEPKLCWCSQAFMDELRSTLTWPHEKELRFNAAEVKVDKTLDGDSMRFES